MKIFIAIKTTIVDWKNFIFFSQDFFLRTSHNIYLWLISTRPRCQYLRVKGKVHPCTGTDTLYRLYGP